MTAARVGLCHGCGHEFPVTTARGPAPTRCDPCDPDSARRRDLQQRRRDVRGGERAQLLQRIADLQQQLRDSRRDPTATPSRRTLAIAVRRVGTAEGRDQTAARLCELAAEARAWAELIRVDSRELRR